MLYSQTRSVTLGQAITELVRRGVHTPTPTRLVDGFVLLDIAPGGPDLTSDRVKELLDSDIDDSSSLRR